MAATIEATTIAGYLPDAEPMAVKLVAERGTGRLLGGQIVGEERSAKRIDTLAVALHARLRVEELIDLDLAYAPPFSSTWDPIHRGRPRPRRLDLTGRLTCQTGAWHWRRGRAALEGDRALVGRALCRAYSDLVDDWLAELLAAAEAECGAGGVALVAVGGYGRAELSLQSDIDVVLLHAGRSDIGALADRVWYPIWDEGLKLGHAVRTPREALALAADDLDTATSLLQVRHVAGDDDLTDDLARRSLEQWQKRAKRWLEELSRRVRERHETAGEVAFLLEPDLKEGRGGPARRPRAALGRGGPAACSGRATTRPSRTAYAALLSARVELHRRTGRPGDRLLLEEQDGVAAALGEESPTR